MNVNADDRRRRVSLRDWKMKTSHGQCRQTVPGRISRRLQPTTPVTRAHTLAKA